MINHYNELLEQGLEYQDWLIPVLLKKGIMLMSYSSRRYQFNIGDINGGESLGGIEVKFDNQMAKTGNVYIEIGEKKDRNTARYVDSGIMRNDNTWLYVIGDRENVYIFSKKQLKHFTQKDKLRRIENNVKTSVGFLLPISKADIWCVDKINLKNNTTETI